MNIVIQNVETREFLASATSEWVKDLHHALIFEDTRHALAYCRSHHLRDVRLVVFFRNHNVSLLLYVPGSSVPAPDGATKKKQSTKPEPVLS